MSEILIQGEYILRLFLAALCGGLIGYERKHRMKEAGIRTHLIVALGSALMMIVSKYGFFDLVGMLGDTKLDPSRVAAQIVSGVGFLGAGMIFVKRQTISGLTTAAGIWATAGVGMAVGAGMYTIGIASSVIIFVMQTILHGKWFTKKMLNISEEISVMVTEESEALDYLLTKLEERDIEILNMRVKRIPEKGVDLKLFIKFPKGHVPSELIEVFKDSKYIKTIDL